MATKKELAVEHYTTNLNINSANVCAKCPLRIYADEDDKIILGVGNIITDTILVLPSYDVKAKIGYTTMLKILQEAYKCITGIELLEDTYVTRAIKCFNKTDFNLEVIAIKSCITNLLYEIGRITPRKIIIFDRRLHDFTYNNITIKTVISPGVMYYDNDNLKEIFMEQLKEALNDS